LKDPKEIHVFDLDQTLIISNSSFNFGIYLYRKGVLPFLTMISLIWYYFVFKMGWCSIETLHHNICNRYFCGLSRSEIEMYAEQFLSQYFQEILYAPAYHELCLAKQTGHYTVLLSSSPDFLVKKFADYFEVDEWAATIYHSVNDKIVEVSQLMVGSDKAFYLNDLINRKNVDKKNVWAYSDSHLDLPFLEAAGQPIGVNPDRILRGECEKNGWTII